MNRLAAVAVAALAIGAAMSPVTAPIALGQTRVATGAAPRLVNLPRGQSFAVDLPGDARDVIVSNPAIAEAMLHSPRRITVVGLAPGETDAVFLDASGRTILALRVRVDAATSALEDTLSRIVPGGTVRAEAVNDSIILTGRVSSPAEADRAAQVARAFVSAPEKVMNMIAVDGSEQVTLKVRIVEVQRNVIKQLGFSTDIVRYNGIHSYGFGRANSFAVNGGDMGGGGACYGQDGAKTTNVTSTEQTVTGAIESIATTAFKTITGTNATGCLQAFERVGLVRTLAEPNLTSINGENASFLAGGEFPVPVGRDSDGNILTEYKPYGVSLAFRPVVRSGGAISLQISTEVSELTPEGGLTLGAGTATAISLPGLSVRRAQTTVELPSGGSLMIAGLLEETTRQNIDSLPGMTSLPVLGSLFRSRDFLSGETELVVIVEPYLVNPTSPDRIQTPADGLRIANDPQTVLMGQLNQIYGSPAPSAAGGGWQGPVGYVIE